MQDDSFFLTNRLVSFVVRRRQRDHQVEHSTTHFGITNAGEGAIELPTFAGGQERDVEGLLRFRKTALARGFPGYAREKIIDAGLEGLRRLPETDRADAIGAFLVLLDLLKRYTQKLPELALTHTQRDS